MQTVSPFSQTSHCNGINSKKFIISVEFACLILTLSLLPSTLLKSQELTSEKIMQVAVLFSFVTSVLLFIILLCHLTRRRGKKASVIFSPVGSSQQDIHFLLKKYTMYFVPGQMAAQHSHRYRAYTVPATYIYKILVQIPQAERQPPFISCYPCFQLVYKVNQFANNSGAN